MARSGPSGVDISAVVADVHATFDKGSKSLSEAKVQRLEKVDAAFSELWQRFFPDRVKAIEERKAAALAVIATALTAASNENVVVLDGKTLSGKKRAAAEISKPATAPVAETQGASKRARRSADAEVTAAGDEFAFRQSGGHTEENIDEKKTKAEAKRSARGKAATTASTSADTTPEAAPAPAPKGRGARGKKTSNSSAPESEPEAAVATAPSTQLEICTVIDNKVKVQALLEYWNEATWRSIVSLSETSQNHPLSLSILAFSVDATAFFIAVGVSISQAFTVGRTLGSSMPEEVFKKPINACQLHAAAMAAHIGAGSRSLKVKALKAMAAMLDPSDEDNARMVARTYLEENVASKRGFPVEQLSAALAIATSTASEAITASTPDAVASPEHVEAEQIATIKETSAMEIEPAEEAPMAIPAPSIAEAAEPAIASMEVQAVTEAALDACESNLEKDDELTSLPDIDMDMPSLTSNIPAAVDEPAVPEAVSVEETAPEAAVETSPVEKEIVPVSTPIQAVTPQITPAASKLVAKAEADDQAEKEKALRVEQAKARVDAFRSKFNVANNTPASDGASPPTADTTTTPPAAIVSPEAAIVPQPAPAPAPAVKTGAIRVPSAIPSLKPAVPVQGNRPSADPTKGTALQKSVDRMKAREQISIAVTNKKTLIESGKTGPVASMRPIGPAAVIKPAPVPETKPVDTAVSKPALEAGVKPALPSKPHLGTNAIPLLGLVPRNGGMIAVAAGLTDKPTHLQQLLSPMPVRSVPGMGNHHTQPLTLQSLQQESLMNTAAAGSMAVVDAMRDAGVTSVVTKIELPPKVVPQPVKEAPVAPKPAPVVAPVVAATPAPLPAPAPAPTTVASNTSAPIASLVSPTSLLFKQNTVVLKAADHDNYEMSDKEDTDDEEEEEDEDDDRPKKKVPDWAHGSALAEAIHKQYGDDAVDPDVIFPEIQSCDLEDIFKVKKKRFAKRTSSGNWNQDRLRDGEKRQYRKDMGFDSS